MEAWNEETALHLKGIMGCSPTYSFAIITKKNFRKNCILTEVKYVRSKSITCMLLPAK